MLRKKKMIVIFLVFTILFSTAITGFASQNNSAYSNIKCVELKSAIDNPVFSNLNDLSKEELKLLREVTRNPKVYLNAAEVYNGQKIYIYDTINPNVKIAVTDGYVEVITKISDDVFRINGEIHTIIIEEVIEEIVDYGIQEDFTIQATGSWLVIPNPGGAWWWTHSTWYNVRLEQAIVNYTVGALAVILAFVTLPKLAAAAIAMASIFIANSPHQASVCKIYKMCYDHMIAPMLYKAEIHYCYAVFQGNDIYLGGEFVYYGWAPNW